MKIKLTQIIFFISLLIFISGVTAKLNTPLVEWDYLCYSAAQDWSQGINSVWYHDHPPGYSLFLTAAFKIFGASLPVARAANALCILITALIVYLLALKFTEKETGLWATILYLISPISIQGSAVMDVADTTLLPLGFMSLFWVIAHTYNSNRNLLDILLSALIWTLCFWLKLTSTLLILLIVLFLYPLIYPNGLNRHWGKIILGGIIGLVVFIISWSLLSLFLWGKESWLVVLNAVWGGFKARILHEIGLRKLVILTLYALRNMLWFSPFFLILFVWKICSVWRLRKKEDFKRLVLLSVIAFFYFFIYFLGGTSWGFVRYHAAIFPLMVVLVAILVEPVISQLNKREGIIFLSGLTILIVVSLLFFRDPLLFFNLKFKEILLAGRSIVPDLIRYFLQALIFCAIVLLGVLLLKKTSFKQKIILAMLMGILGYSVYLDLIQLRASYVTSYEYGSRGKQQTVKSILEYIQKGDTVLAVPDLIYELRNKEAPNLSLTLWQSEKSILDFIKTRAPKVIVMGLTTHTLKQWRQIPNNPEIKMILGQQYTARHIGTYTVWFKK